MNSAESAGLRPKGNVPTLRFPEFKGEWLATTIDDVTSEFQSGKIIKADLIQSKGFVPVYGGNGLRGYTDMYNHTGDYVLIGRQGALCGNVRFVTGKTYITEHAIAVKGTEDNDTKYLQYLFETMNLRQYSDQSAQPGLAVGKLIKLKITVPQKREQSKIARLLTVIEERITTQIRIIEKLKSLISGLTQRISKHSSIRMVLLSELLIERNEKNTELFPVHSVSVSEGVVNQIDYLGRSFASADTSHYNVAHKGDIIYTKSPTGEFPFGIVKRNSIESNVAVSPLYGVYQPISDDVAIYLHYYFCSPLNAQNYLHKLIQKGAKNTINITNQRFLENHIPLPDKKTLARFVKLTSAVSTKLRLEKSLLEALQRQKRYLLTSMFI